MYNMKEVISFLCENFPDGFEGIESLFYNSTEFYGDDYKNFRVRRGAYKYCIIPDDENFVIKISKGNNRKLWGKNGDLNADLPAFIEAKEKGYDYLLVEPHYMKWCDSEIEVTEYVELFDKSYGESYEDESGEYHSSDSVLYSTLQEYLSEDEFDFIIDFIRDLHIGQFGLDSFNHIRFFDYSI